MYFLSLKRINAAPVIVNECPGKVGFFPKRLHDLFIDRTPRNDVIINTRVLLPDAVDAGPRLFIIAHGIIGAVENQYTGGGQCDAEPRRSDLPYEHHKIGVCLEPGDLFLTVGHAAHDTGITDTPLFQEPTYRLDFRNESGDDYQLFAFL
jgi:hypothetical protein